jgi:hypothetical protein
VSRHSVVTIVTRLRDGGWRNRPSIPCRDNTFLSSLKHPDRLWNPPSLLFNGYQGLISRNHEVDHSPPCRSDPRLRKSAAILTLPSPLPFLIRTIILKKVILCETKLRKKRMKRCSLYSRTQDSQMILLVF